jgi:hypothetical protein
VIRCSWSKGRRSRRQTALAAVVAALAAVASQGLTRGLHADITGLAVVCIAIAAVALVFVILRLRCNNSERTPRDGARG